MRQQKLSKRKQPTIVVIVEQGEKASAIMFNYLEVRWWNLQKYENRIRKGSRILQFSFLRDVKDGLVCAKGRIEQNYSAFAPKAELSFNAKHQVLLRCKTHPSVALFLRKEKQTRRRRVCKKKCSAEDVNPRHKKCLTINRDQVF